MTIHETAAKLASVNARIAAMAQTSNDACLRLTARIQELEGALSRVTENYADLREAYFPTRDNTGDCPSIKHARAILAKGN